MKHTKQALFHSIVALILCCSMLVGTTFAWFTDEVTSGVNKIQAGNLDIELEYLDGGDWKPVKSDKSVFPEGILWEPGHTEVVYLRIVNKGNLALKYQLGIGVEGETLSVTESGEVIQLSKYIHFGAVDGVSVPFANRDAARAAVTESKALTAGYTKTGTMTATNETAYMALVVYMPESVGNEANHATGADAPTINMGIRLLATQLNSEMDSFGSDYDANAAWPYMSIKRSITRSISGKIDAATGNLTETIVFGDADDAQRAEIPANVKLAAGADELTFSITSMEKPNADVNTKTRDEILRSIDIHVEGVAEDNTVPMTFVLKELFPKGLNDNNVKLYHVEGDETKEMTLASAPANHNEFSYDPLTGDAVVTIATFSEVATYADTNAPWDGKTYDYSWYTADGDLTIANANQFAAFRNIVDGVEINGVYTIDDFKGQKITLGADINLNGHNFDPIGWGYDNTAWNAGGAEGKVFKGHFNGGYHTIYGLLQSGWELTNEGTNKPYTYTNCGFGLFAAALDATFENLTIDGANIRVECVETGVLVGLAQGSCTFKNITIAGCKIANYQRPAGGVVGEVSPKIKNGAAVASTHTFDNVYVDPNTVVGSLWGDFDAPCGGVIGAYWDDAGETTVVMDQVTVACRLDVYNDVTSTYQWYAYRRAGMLIGDANTKVTIDFTKPAGGTSPCVTSDTLVTLADGTQKRIDEVTYSDQLLVWDFFKGEYTVVPGAIIFDHGYDNNTVIELMFSDGSSVKAVNLHQFFDADLNRFVDIDANSVADYVGHRFAKMAGNGYAMVTLVDYKITQEYCEAWGLISAEHYNIFVNGMLSTDFMYEDYALFNYFEVGEDMKFDEEKMQADIEKYGLYTYEDFDHVLTYEQFVAFNVQYFKIAVGKGEYTYEGILALIDTYLNN